RLQTVNGGNVLQDLRYTLDNVSNLLSINDARTGRTAQNDQTQGFVYDALYRLLRADGTYGAIDYGYDSIGNLVQKTSAGSTGSGSTGAGSIGSPAGAASEPQLNMGAMRYGENGAGPHALTSANGESWHYDANGNLRQKGQTQYGWDARNQLTSVDDGNLLSTFVYDAEGQRVKQRVQAGAALTTTLYAGQYAEIRGNDLIFYVFDEQSRVAEVVKPLDRTQLLQGFSDTTPSVPANGERHWYVADNLGGTSLLLDGQGTVVSEVAYYPFGATRYAENGGQVHYRFTGHEQDASGLIYANARYYEPVTGRFISVDPLFVEEPLKGTKNPQLLNLYAYALNNPNRYTDPDGTEPEALEKVSMKGLQSVAAGFAQTQKEYGYDPEKLLRNPRLSPEMTWQLKGAMSEYHLMRNEANHRDRWVTARVTRAFDSSDRGSIYDMGGGADVQIFDKQGRYIDPQSKQGQTEYAAFTRQAESYGFTTSLVTSDKGQSYIRLQYTPKGWDRNDGKLLTAAEVQTHRSQMGWHMQDLRKYYWKIS
ncbi:MAG: hypothetical protein KDE53_39955, partial [Caldilineaceae bacterium]|nr:hypothetical protein [Caldilineaceae bacterium]